MHYDVPSLRERGLVPLDQRCSDYYPLTREEVVSLLVIAAQAGACADWHTVASIQVRLCQGVPGVTSPRVAGGPAMLIEREVSRLYVSGYRFGPDPDLVEKLCQLMQCFV